ncbi:MAG: carbon-nitrogen hydrolase family protein [Candidatus Edwardsbacteria bacterium]|nr:carbon-nitrogen hydrolase family protein [Candidatus Edwardsbacteria bacterium]
MRAALAVIRIGSDIGCNRDKIIGLIEQSSAQSADLVLFPEAALTGLINNDDPGHDRPLSCEIPGPFTDLIAATAAKLRIHVGLGLLERDCGALYDSAVLFNDEGQLALHYRRMTSGWHGPKTDAAVYQQGTAPGCAETALGRMAFLLCGDLFDDEVLAQAKFLRPDFLLYPFARDLKDYSCDQRQWDADEFPHYAERVAMLGAPALMVNYIGTPEIEDDSFGGAMIVSGTGELLSQLPLGQEGLLVADV